MEIHFVLMALTFLKMIIMFLCVFSTWLPMLQLFPDDCTCSPLTISSVFLYTPPSWPTYWIIDWALCAIHSLVSARVETLFLVSDSQCCCFYVLVCRLALCLQRGRVDSEASHLFLWVLPSQLWCICALGCSKAQKFAATVTKLLGLKSFSTLFVSLIFQYYFLF